MTVATGVFRRAGYEVEAADVADQRLPPGLGGQTGSHVEEVGDGGRVLREDRALGEARIPGCGPDRRQAAYVGQCSVEPELERAVVITVDALGGPCIGVGHTVHDLLLGLDVGGASLASAGDEAGRQVTFGLQRGHQGQGALLQPGQRGQSAVVVGLADGVGDGTGDQGYGECGGNRDGRGEFAAHGPVAKTSETEQRATLGQLPFGAAACPRGSGLVAGFRFRGGLVCGYVAGGRVGSSWRHCGKLSVCGSRPRAAAKGRTSRALRLRRPALWGLSGRKLTLCPGRSCAARSRSWSAITAMTG